MRVIRTARELGYRTVAVFSEADADSLHVTMADEAVCIGAAPVGESYLVAENVLQAAAKTGAGPRKKIKPEIEYDWLATGKDGKIYIHLFKWPSGPFVLSNLEGKVSKAYLLADPKKKSLPYTQTAETLTVTLPATPLDDKATVLCLVFK